MLHSKALERTGHNYLVEEHITLRANKENIA